jgi:hypothetical protein
MPEINTIKMGCLSSLMALKSQKGECPNISIVMEFKTLPSTEKVNACVNEMMTYNFRMSCYTEIENGKCHWKPFPKTFDYSQCIENISFNGSDPEEEKNNFISSRVDQPLNGATKVPLFKFYMVSYDKIPDKYEIIVFIDHSLGDGTYLCNLLMMVALPLRNNNSQSPQLSNSNLFKDRNNAKNNEAAFLLNSGRSRSVVETNAEVNVSNRVSNFCKATSTFLHFSVLWLYHIMIGVLWNILLSIASFFLVITIPFTPKDTPLTMNAINIDQSDYYIAPKAQARRSFSVQDFKQISKKESCKINDVIMSVLNSTISHWEAIQESDQRKDSCDSLTTIKDRKTFFTKKKEFTLVAIVNTRALGKEGAQLLKQDQKRDNISVGYVPVTNSLNVSLCPKKRLNKTHKQMKWLKTSPTPVLLQFMNEVIHAVLPLRVFEFITDYTQGKFSGYVSNLVGPRKPIQFGGAEVLNIYNGVNCMRFGVGFSIFTYHNTLNITVTSNTHMIANPDKFLDIFSDELLKLKRAIGLDPVEQERNA